jgi:hypothetical protein
VPGGGPRLVRVVLQRMSWMLSRHPPDYPRLDDVAHTYGRALMLATNFEQSCRVLLRFLNLEDVLDHDPTLRLEAAIQRVPRDALLKRTLEGIASQLGTVPDAVAILVNAREGRNFIAHEAAIWPPLNMPRYGSLREVLAPTAVGREVDRLRALERLGEPLLRRHVTAVAHGEVLVGGWLHEFHEREPAPATFTQSYPCRVDNWVLEPVMDLLSD